MLPPGRSIVTRADGIYALERTLRRRGFLHVAGADEAGRGACAGPLVAAAVILPAGRRGEIEGLTDSKLLTPQARERIYDAVVKRAVTYRAVVIPPGEVDSRGLHVCNLDAMRRALAGLSLRPDYVLTDGFPVDGLGVPGLAVWKGDLVAACVSAASVVAKVTRDRIMRELDVAHPEYGFAEHKGYVTAEHSAALDRYGPCQEHRYSYVNVAAAAARCGGRGTVGVATGTRMPLRALVGKNGGMGQPPAGGNSAAQAAPPARIGKRSPRSSGQGHMVGQPPADGVLL